MTTNQVEKSAGKKVAGGLAKFLVGTLMFVILLAITIVVMGLAVFEFFDSNMDTPVALTIGIILSVIYAAIVFIIPYLRKSSTIKWFAICALGDAAWWAYLLIAG